MTEDSLLKRMREDVDLYLETGEGDTRRLVENMRDAMSEITVLISERDSAAELTRAIVGPLRDKPQAARPLDQWHEGLGDCIWYCLDEIDGTWLGEPPYLGSPLDCGITIEVRSADAPDDVLRKSVGGWPGYHTHFIPLPAIPQVGDA